MKVSEDFFDNFNDLEVLQKKRNDIEPVLQIVKKFLIDNKVILYGGTAMNLYLPKNKQFYSDLDIPDYDGYSSKAKELSISLINVLKTKKYDFLLVKYALHEGTYKLAWEFKDIADFTNIHKTEYENILKKSVQLKGNGLYIAPLNLLKSNSYIELGMPKSSMFRWKKVFTRLQLLENTFPLKSNILKSNIFTTTLKDDIVVELINKINTYIQFNHLPLLGNSAIKFYLGMKNCDKYLDNKYFRFVQVLSNEMYTTIEDVKKILGTYKDIEYVTTTNTESQLVPNKISIDIIYNKKKYRLISVFDATKSCYGVISSKGNVFGSVFLLMNVYYYYLFMRNENSKTSGILKRVMLELSKNINESSFTTSCYGFDRSMSVIKKSRVKKGKPTILKSFINAK